MIDVYSWATPNGHKIHIMLEECGYRLDRDWRAIPVDIGKGDQFKPAFLKISPNNKIPAIVDPNGPDGKPIHLFESGAILLYLANKTGRFLPTSIRGKYETMEWLMFQMGGLGPMLGQNHHFRLYAPEKVEYAINRYTNEAKRLYGVLDARLKKNKYIVGNEYTIADIATWPWIINPERRGVDMALYPHVQRWFEEILARPAVQAALAVQTVVSLGWGAASSFMGVFVISPDGLGTNSALFAGLLLSSRGLVSAALPCATCNVVWRMSDCLHRQRMPAPIARQPSSVLRASRNVAVCDQRVSVTRRRGLR